MNLPQWPLSVCASMCVYVCKWTLKPHNTAPPLALFKVIRVVCFINGVLRMASQMALHISCFLQHNEMIVSSIHVSALLFFVSFSQSYLFISTVWSAPPPPFSIFVNYSLIIFFQPFSLVLFLYCFFLLLMLSPFQLSCLSCCNCFPNYSFHSAYFLSSSDSL